MPDWKDLTEEAMALVQDSQSYLGARLGQTADPEERDKLEKLAARLAAHHEQVSNIIVVYAAGELSPDVLSAHEPDFTRFSSELESARLQVRELHEYFDYGKVDSAFRVVEDRLADFYSAGPHGPGKGPDYGLDELREQPERPQKTGRLGPGPHGPGTGPKLPGDGRDWP